MLYFTVLIYTKASAESVNTKVGPHRLTSFLVVTQNLQARMMSRKILVMSQSRAARQDVRVSLWKPTTQSGKYFNFQAIALIFWLVYILVGNIYSTYSYSSNMHALVCVGLVIHSLTHELKLPLLLRSSSSQLFVINFPCHFWPLSTLQNSVSQHIFILTVTSSVYRYVLYFLLAL